MKKFKVGKLVRRIIFGKWMEQSGVVGEKILSRKVGVKNSSLKIN